MKKFVPIEKRSKKARRAAATAQRGNWYGISPVTRIVPNKKKYSRPESKAALRKIKY